MSVYHPAKPYPVLFALGNGSFSPSCQLALSVTIAPLVFAKFITLALSKYVLLFESFQFTKSYLYAATVFVLPE